MDSPNIQPEEENHMSIGDTALVQDLVDGKATPEKRDLILAKLYIKSEKSERAAEKVELATIEIKRIAVERDKTIGEHGELIHVLTAKVDIGNEKLNQLAVKVDNMHPAVQSLTTDQKRWRWFIGSALTILASCGIGMMGYLWTSGGQVVYVAKLNDTHIEAIAAKRDENLKAEIAKVNDNLERKIEKVEWTLRADLGAPKYKPTP